MSEIKVNKITPRTACGTTQLGDSGDTITIPSGATISNLGTATGFGGTGVVSWDTGSIKTTGFTAVTGTGYFCNTTGGGFTVTLPLSPSAGDVIGVADYAKTFDSDNCTLGRNSSNIAGEASDAILNTAGIAVTLVYVDGTKGWIVTDSGNQSDAPLPTYITATGGCVTTCGNYKMHTFLSPNSFVVCSVGNCAGSNTVSYVVVAGGGGGGDDTYPAPRGGGGGGAGGYRESKASTDSYTASPLNATSGPGYNLPVSASPYPIIIGGGGAGGPYPAAPAGGTRGDDSSFSTITSTGGGAGMGHGPSGTSTGTTTPGGSGGAYQIGEGGTPQTVGLGNEPPVSPPQGNNGTEGSGSPGYSYGGGGGAGAVGGSASPPCTGGAGGVGVSSSITASSVSYAGGGGSSGPVAGAASPCGTGGSGAGSAGTINRGGGGGGNRNATGGLGGSGIVIIRYKYQ